MRYLYTTLLILLAVTTNAQDGDNVNAEMGGAIGLSMPRENGVNRKPNVIFRFVTDVNVDGRDKPFYFSGGLRFGADWGASTGPSINIVGGACYAFHIAENDVVRFNILIGPVFEFETYTHLIGLRTNIATEANANVFIDKRISIGAKYYRPLLVYSGDVDFTINALMFCMMFRLN